MNTSLLKFICRVNGLLHQREFQYSRSSEGNFLYMDFSEKLWWGYKYYYHQVERAQKGKHIEEYFEGQNLSYQPEEGFAEQSSVSLSAGGDILASNHIRPDSTKNVWDDVRDFYFGSDIVVANLETPVAQTAEAHLVPKNITSAPALNSSPEIFERYYLGGKGINFFSTANNHCLDMGESGLVSTLDFLDSKGCSHVGTARSAADRDDIPVISKNGIRIAFLSYTFSTNGKPVPEGKDYLVNYLRLNKPDCDISLIEKHVRIAKVEKKADIVVACVHWSLEFESYPIQNVIDMGHKLAALGIDVILGNHPHTIQPMEKFAFLDPYSGVRKQGFIVYALGDLISCHENLPNSRIANLVKLRISKGTLDGQELTRITDLKIKPLLQYPHMKDGLCDDFRLLDFVKLMDALDHGINSYHIDPQSMRELRRLQSLMYKLLKKERMA